jgi:hypothetical protein
MKTWVKIFVACVLIFGAFSQLAAEEIAGSNLKLFKEKDKFGFKNERGKIVISPEFDDAYEFSMGLACVNRGAKWDPTTGRRFGGVWGLIDAQGKTVVPFTLYAAFPFSEGLARVKDDLMKTRFIDAQGKTVFEVENVWAGDFHEGLSRVRVENRTKYLDKTGKTVFTVDGEGDDFHEGLASLGVAMEGKKGRVYGYIDKDGNQVLKPQFIAAKNFSEGLAAVRTNHNINPQLAQDESWGYIDKSGNFVIKPQYNEARPFIKDKAWVHTGGTYVITSGPRGWQGGEWFLIDKKGNVLERKKQ